MMEHKKYLPVCIAAALLFVSAFYPPAEDICCAGEGRQY